MTASYYAQLLDYARRFLPRPCVLEPGDLVNEAYLQVGATNQHLLLKTIRGLALRLRGQSAFVPFHGQSKKAINETSRLCPACNREKALDDFRLMRYRNLPMIYRLNQCNECTSRSAWQRRKKRHASDPGLDSRYKQQSINAQKKHYANKRATMSEPEREKRRQRCRDWRAKIKADPVAYAAYLEKARQQGARYNAQVKADPVKRDARNQRLRDWRKAQSTKVVQLPISSSLTTALAA